LLSSLVSHFFSSRPRRAAPVAAVSKYSWISPPQLSHQLG
jgi:hypothetical protein